MEFFQSYIMNQLNKKLKHLLYIFTKTTQCWGTPVRQSGLPKPFCLFVWFEHCKLFCLFVVKLGKRCSFVLTGDKVKVAWSNWCKVSIGWSLKGLWPTRIFSLKSFLHYICLLIVVQFFTDYKPLLRHNISDIHQHTIWDRFLTWVIVKISMPKVSSF